VAHVVNRGCFIRRHFWRESKWLWWGFIGQLIGLGDAHHLKKRWLRWWEQLEEDMSCATHPTGIMQKYVCVCVCVCVSNIFFKGRRHVASITAHLAVRGGMRAGQFSQLSSTGSRTLVYPRYTSECVRVCVCVCVCVCVERERETSNHVVLLHLTLHWASIGRCWCCWWRWGCMVNNPSRGPWNQCVKMRSGGKSLPRENKQTIPCFATDHGRPTRRTWTTPLGRGVVGTPFISPLREHGLDVRCCVHFHEYNTGCHSKKQPSPAPPNVEEREKRRAGSRAKAPFTFNTCQQY